MDINTIIQPILTFLATFLGADTVSAISGYIEKAVDFITKLIGG